LAAHVRHNIDELFSTGHNFFEELSKFGRIARFANESVVNDNHMEFGLVIFSTKGVLLEIMFGN
jgi:hypothetical protein